MQTASLAASYGTNDAVDNAYGWGIIDVMAAINYSPSCCMGKVGDANGEGGDTPTISDIGALIDYLFITGGGVTCLEEADVNQSGGASPVAGDITVGDISTLIDHLFITGAALADCP